MSKKPAKRPKRKAPQKRKASGQITVTKLQLSKLIAREVAKLQKGTVTQGAKENTTGRRTRRPISRTRMHWTDGVNWYLRRKACAPEANGTPHAIVLRTQQKVDAGELTYVRTYDDVEVYEIATDSKLRRRPLQLNQMTPDAIVRVIVTAACSREWRLYYDAVQELSYMLKNSELPAPQAHQILQNTMKYLHMRIARRGGPNDYEIRRELASVRTDRTGSRIFLPPSQNIDRR